MPLAELGLRISGVFRRVVPDPFVLAVLLTIATFVLVVTTTETKPSDLVDHWAGASGIWSLLGFAMQMCLILVTGHALASSPPMQRVIGWLASLPRSGAQAAAMVGLLAAMLGMVNWGLGLVAGALLARRVGEGLERGGIPAHYPLLAAAGYMGMLVWHGGFSGTAPLKVTTEADIIELLGTNARLSPISLDQTVLSPMNLVISGGLLLLVPAILAMLSPSSDRCQPCSAFVEAKPATPEPTRSDKAFIPRLLEDTPILSVVLVAMIGWWAWRFAFPPGGGPSGFLSLNPNSVNLLMLMLGLLLHGTPMRYVRAVEEAARGCAGIIIQFPLYAGIMGMMRVSGLGEDIASTIASWANETTLPIFTLISAGGVNLFVPSGGGQWAVQGPIVVQTSIDLGIDPAKNIMALAYGDQLTNMLQPFWALPLLAITGVKARDIVGYTAIVMLIAAVWMGIGLVLL